MKYEFTAKVWNYSSTVGTGGWHIACLPKEMSKEIRENLGFLEEGWGRLKMTAKTGNTQWETAIWFDTKLDTYLLPLKAEIRKKEKITTDNHVVKGVTETFEIVQAALVLRVVLLITCFKYKS